MKKLTILFPFIFILLSCAQGDNNDDADVQSIDYDVEERLAELNITLNESTPPTANYVRAVRSGNLIFLAGHGPDKPDGGQVNGKMGKDLSLEEGQEAARFTGISLLASLKEAVGDLNRVKKIVKVLGMVNAESDFTEHSQVINGFSDLMVEVFGENGRHARASVGMSSLPGNIPVEIEMIVEIED